ncbi:MAG: BatD family protein [Bacteroidota bacterium]
MPFIFFLTGLNMQAQKLTATCKYSKVALNSTFQVSFTLTNGKATQFTRPAFTGFSVLGSYQSSGGGMTVIVNGKVVSGGNDETTWTYTLKPTAVGKYTIDEAKANVSGTWITSNSLSVEVTTSTSTATTSTNTTTKSTTTTATTNASDDDVFLKAYVDNASPYEGEQVIVTYKIYYRIPVGQCGIEKLPSYTGFWSEEITKAGDEAVQTTETIGGIKYTAAEIRKVALFPEKSGALNIDPLDLKCVVQVVTKQQYNDPFGNFFNDPFFNNFTKSFFNSYSEEEKTITSNSLSINVKELPSADQPSEFSGSVGSFTFDAELDKTDLKTNEAANLTFTLKGSGNLSMAELPDIDFPADVETYDPEIKENIIPTVAGISGSKTFSYLIIPRIAGTFTIKPVKFCYYDLTKKEYITLESPEFTLNVEKGSGDDASASSASKEDIKYLNSDIHFIKSSPIFLTNIGSFFYGSPFFFGLIALPLLLFFLFVIIYRRRLKENSNIALMKNKKATSVAHKRLNTANAFLKENKKEAFLDEVFKALWGYVSDKLSIPLSELSKETVSDKFELINVNEKISKQFITTLNNCEFARFAPDDGTITMNSIYDEAAGIITKMEHELR